MNTPSEGKPPSDQEQGADVLDAYSPTLGGIWNPLAIAALCIPLGFLFGSILVALNWHALRKHFNAGWVWAFAVFYCFCIQQPLIEMVRWPWPYVIGLLVWFPPVGLTQYQYVRRAFPDGFRKRPWLLPVSMGIALQVAVMIWNRVGNLESQSGKASFNSSPPQAKVYSPDQLAAEMGPTVVEVQTRWREPFLIFFSQANGKDGSAVLIQSGANGYSLVTNRHVVEPPADSSQYTCVLNVAGTIVPTEVAAYARNGLDLALLHVASEKDTPNFNMPLQPLERVVVGEQCVAIGNALGAGSSVTTGVISRVDDFGSHRRIRTSAPISPGNSGGGLFSLNGGSLLGITTSEITTPGSQNVNFAIPTDYFSSRDAWDYSTTKRP